MVKRKAFLTASLSLNNLRKWSSEEEEESPRKKSLRSRSSLNPPTPESSNSKFQIESSPVASLKSSIKSKNKKRLVNFNKLNLIKSFEFNDEPIQLNQSNDNSHNRQESKQSKQDSKDSEDSKDSKLESNQEEFEFYTIKAKTKYIRKNNGKFTRSNSSALNKDSTDSKGKIKESIEKKGWIKEITSCQECYKRKVICDRKQPCKSCIPGKRECIYSIERRACSDCKLRKVKCDRNRPCNKCIKRNKECDESIQFVNQKDKEEIIIISSDQEEQEQEEEEEEESNYVASLLLPQELKLIQGEGGNMKCIEEDLEIFEEDQWE